MGFTLHAQTSRNPDFEPSAGRGVDTGTLQYNIFFNADQSQALVLERCRDSAALAEHLGNIGDDLMAAVTATGILVRNCTTGRAFRPLSSRSVW